MEYQSRNDLIYIAAENDGCVFLRDVLRRKMQLSNGLLAKLKQGNRISVNGIVTRANYRMMPGDEVRVNVEFEEKTAMVPDDIPLSIVYEDDDVLVIDKPSGLAVHPSNGRDRGTLGNAVLHHWVAAGVQSKFRPVNRLDKDTSGLILIAKSQYAHQRLFTQQKDHSVQRLYMALVEGIITESGGIIDLPIAHPDPSLRMRMVDESGSWAVTHFRVMGRFQDHTLLALMLETGRTHQIRVHTSHIGHPICGDRLYGRPSPLIDRQALHAAFLAFRHPRTDQPVWFTAQLPEDIKEALVMLGAAELPENILEIFDELEGRKHKRV